jgi:hypothetical protein
MATQPEIQNDSTLADIVGKLNKPGEFVRRVLERLHECKRVHDSASVRLGIMGRGRAPNYRIEYPEHDQILNEQSIAVFGVFNGLSHKEIEDLGFPDLAVLFDPDAPPGPERMLRYGHWSSKTMGLDDVARLLGELRKRR